MTNIAENVRPGDRICTTDEPGMRDRTKRLAYIGGVCDMPVCGEQKCANAIRITRVPVRGIGRVYRTVAGLILFFFL